MNENFNLRIYNIYLILIILAKLDNKFIIEISFSLNYFIVTIAI